MYDCTYDSAKVAEKIKQQAKAVDVQLKDMLAELKLNKNTLSNMYNGSMLKTDNLAKIADFFNCSIDYLLGRTDNPRLNKDELTEEEYKILSSYREDADIKEAFNKLLENR